MGGGNVVIWPDYEPFFWLTGSALVAFFFLGWSYWSEADSKPYSRGLLWISLVSFLSVGATFWLPGPSGQVPNCLAPRCYRWAFLREHKRVYGFDYIPSHADRWNSGTAYWYDVSRL